MIQIHSPVLEIPENEPYKWDLFGRKEFGDSLSSLLRNVGGCTVICIDALWGDGKTSFARMWRADLCNQGITSIYYDAYQHDYSEDPFVSFSAEIISLLDQHFKDNSEIRARRHDFKRKAKKVGARLLSFGAGIGAKALTLGIIGPSEIEAINSIRQDLASGSAEAMSTFVERALDNYAAAEDHVTEFTDSLSQLGDAVMKQTGFPLLIIVDELDRCRPDFALTLIERIKHLFTADCVSFVLLAHIAQLENYVRTVYGTDVDAHNYLHKFFTVSTRLPKRTGVTTDNDCSRYIRHLLSHYGMSGNMVHEQMLKELFDFYGFSLREMERCFCVLAMYRAQLSQNTWTDNSLVAFLAVLKTRDPETFNSLARGGLSYEELVKTARICDLEQLEAYHSKTRLMENLKLFLLSDDALSTSRTPGQNQVLSDLDFRHGLDRKSAIPFLCSGLSRFSRQTTQE